MSGQLRRNARILDELDVTLAFGILAAEMNFVRPLLQDKWVLRHGGYFTD
jgi:DNA mismatch repair ATPase MutS